MGESGRLAMRREGKICIVHRALSELRFAGLQSSRHMADAAGGHVHRQPKGISPGGSDKCSYTAIAAARIASYSVGNKNSCAFLWVHRAVKGFALGRR